MGKPRVHISRRVDERYYHHVMVLISQGAEKSSRLHRAAIRSKGVSKLREQYPRRGEQSSDGIPEATKCKHWQPIHVYPNLIVYTYMYVYIYICVSPTIPMYFHHIAKL